MTELQAAPTAEAETQEIHFASRLKALHRKAYPEPNAPPHPDQGTARKALAQLRRGLANPHSPFVYEVLFSEDLAPPDAPSYALTAYVQAASLFGLYVQGLTPDKLPRMPAGLSNYRRHSLGTSGRLLRNKLGNGQESIDRRFNALIDSDPRDLFTRLRHLFRLFHSHDVPVNFRRLLNDLQRWHGSRPDALRKVRRQWAEDYWRPIGDANT